MTQADSDGPDRGRARTTSGSSSSRTAGPWPARRVALAAEMLHGRPVRIEVAAGLDDTTFGTDAVSIKEAIERADGPAGVVVLMDLGSAVLSAELALDLLADPTARDRVTLSAGAHRRGARRRRRRRGRRSQPGRGRRRGARRADGQGRPPRPYG